MCRSVFIKDSSVFIYICVRPANGQDVIGSFFSGCLLRILSLSSMFAADSEQENRSEDRVQEEDENGDEAENKEEQEDSAVATECSPPCSSPASCHAKPYCCHWCKKSFDYKCRMLAHMKRCSMSQECEQQCPECPEKLSKRALQRHRAEAHRSATRVKKKAACDLCGRTFAHPSGKVT